MLCGSISQILAVEQFGGQILAVAPEELGIGILLSTAKEELRWQ